MNRVVVTGAGGRLGTALVRRPGGYSVLALDRQALDLTEPGRIAERLEHEPFDALINCAAITNVDYCEGHPDQARRVNAEAVAELATLCSAKGARLIHISTDYVFAGDRPGLLRESDPAEPRSVYGRSKREGELAALADPRHIVARVSWVFGPERPSFLDMLVERATREDRVSAVADKFSSPAYTADLACWIDALLRPGIPGGVVHLCNPGITSWCEYGQFALDRVREAGIPLRAAAVEPLRLADMTVFVAERPVHTAMDTARFTDWTGIEPRPWQEAVAAYVTDHLVPRLR